ncbi:unnamed protein product, partial [Allacma fusca]
MELIEEAKLVAKVSEYVVAYDFEVYDILGTIHWFRKYRIVILQHNFATSFWGLALMLSKIVELGDTVFIILRKQKLIALHWFHHAATLMMCWIGYEYYETAGRAFFVNAFVHSFMYSYYALKALGFKVPKNVSQALTTLQIVQLSAGVYGAMYILYLLVVEGRPCRMHFETFWFGASAVAIFLVLFI